MGDIWREQVTIMSFSILGQEENTYCVWDLRESFAIPHYHICFDPFLASIKIRNNCNNLIFDTILNLL